MEGVSSSLVGSCAGSSMIVPAGITADQMSAQSCLPSSIRAALSFVSGHATLEQLQFFPSYGDSAAFCPKRLDDGLNLHCVGLKENPIVIEDEQDEDLISVLPMHMESCLDSSIMEKKSRNYVQKQNNYVYKRRKLQRNSVTLLSKQTHMVPQKDFLHKDKINSTWMPQDAKIEDTGKCNVNIEHHDISVLASPCTVYPMNLLQSGNKVINNSLGGFLRTEKYETCLGMHIDCKTADSEVISLCQTGSSKLHLDSKKPDMDVVDVGEVTSGRRSIIEESTSFQILGSPSFQISDCNLKQIAVSTKQDVIDLTECTSSIDCTLFSRESDPEKEWCISVLEEYGLLGWFVSSGEYAAARHPGVVGDGSFSLFCKICSFSEDSTRTLICDMCEEAFHMSCCSPKIKSVPVQDEWHCQYCKKKRKKREKKCLIVSKSSQSILDESCSKSEKSAEDKADLFRHMLQDNQHYTTQVRIGKAFQADVPDWTGKVQDDAETLFLGEPLEMEGAQQNLMNELWSNGWQPVQSLFPGLVENWLQCQNVIEEGVPCPHGRKAKDVICGKWRRAPLLEVQNDDWDCSCAVVWDPVHSDCAVPQELATEEILWRLKATEMAKLQLNNKKRKSKMKHSIVEETKTG